MPAWGESTKRATESAITNSREGQVVIHFVYRDFHRRFSLLLFVFVFDAPGSEVVPNKNAKGAFLLEEPTSISLALSSGTILLAQPPFQFF
jgi:hypothetical protein